MISLVRKTRLIRARAPVDDTYANPYSAIAIYRPSESSGTTLEDVVSGYDGTINTTGKLNGWVNRLAALRTTTASDQVTMPSELRTAFEPDNCTILIWLILPYQPTPAGSAMGIINIDVSNVGITLYLSNAHVLNAAHSGQSNLTIAMANLAFFAPVLVGITFEADDDTYTLYCITPNGTQTAQATNHTGSQGVATINNIWFARAFSGARLPSNYGQVEFYNTELTQEQIEARHATVHTANIATLTQVVNATTYSADTGYSNQDIRITVTALPTTGYIEVCLRYDDADNHVSVHIHDDGSIDLINRVSGSSTVVASAGVSTIESSDVVRVVADSYNQVVVLHDDIYTPLIGYDITDHASETSIYVDSGDGNVTVNHYDTFGV